MDRKGVDILYAHEKCGHLYAQEKCGHLYAQEKCVHFVYKGGFQNFAIFLIFKALLRQD